MAQPLNNILKEISDKARALGDLNKTLYARIDFLESENSGLRQELEECRRQLEISKRDAEFLTMSHRLAESPDTIVSTRRRIARLIRTIDNCISMLKEE